jgi:hypothetical protein
MKIGYSGIKNKPFRVEIGGYINLSNGDRMYIPKEYIFDNASIPIFLKWLHDTFKIKIFSYEHTAFLIHDYLYNFKGYRTGTAFKHKPVTRIFADKEMAFYMKQNGDSKLRINLFFLAVRIFGWTRYGKI